MLCEIIKCWGSCKDNPFEDGQVHAEQIFAHWYPDIRMLFDQAVYNNFTPFQEAALHLIDLKRYS